jgi:hypothetical protein
MTLNLSPKVWQPALATFLLGAVTTLASWGATGQFNKAEAITLGATLVSTLVTGVLGYAAPPGEVVPKDVPAFDEELPGGVTDEQRDAEGIKAT